MNVFRASKVVSALPSTLEADTTYYVRVGTGFDMYVTDTTGQIAHSLNNPDWSVVNKDHSGAWACDVYIQETRFGAWRIRKIDASGVVTVSSSIDAPNANKTAAQAWVDRTTLAYG